MFLESKSPGEATTLPSLAGFIAWLKTKDPEETYITFDSVRCAFGQYYTAIGREPIVWISQIAQEMNLTYETAHDIIGCGRGTFSAALTRAKALRP